MLNEDKQMERHRARMFENDTLKSFVLTGNSVSGTIFGIYVRFPKSAPWTIILEIAFLGICLLFFTAWPKARSEGLQVRLRNSVWRPLFPWFLPPAS